MPFSCSFRHCSGKAASPAPLQDKAALQLIWDDWKGIHGKASASSAKVRGLLTCRERTAPSSPRVTRLPSRAI